MNKILNFLFGFAAFLTAFVVDSKTTYTGDIISGHKVITILDIDDIPDNSFTKLWLRTTQSSIGQYFHVPILVAKGSEQGNRLLLNSGIHGDESNGIRTVQRVLKDIDLSILKGVVVGIPGSNVNGMYNNRREFVNNFETDILTDLNRQFPGNMNNRLAAQKYVRMLWDGVFANNSFTAGVDMHTDTTDNELPNFVYADFTIPYVFRMTELTGADIVKIDLGAGTLGAIENILDYAGIPAITLELGKSKVWQKDQIQRGYDYVFRQMADLGMYPPTEDQANIKAYEEYKSKTFYGNEYSSSGSTNGGYVELHVKNLDVVTNTTKAATVYNVFGDVIEEIYPSFDGIITSVNHYPLNEPGVDIILTIHNSTNPECINGC
ncbi:hypothetical protein AYI68_g4660 [Smittium mucronatum]|uniref:Succinylglutamate desuccinylase/Aspartoacylase catalytic domain-containing protein n=1 Tax=Smittium mucronatum TaxID=133383 RepID=A0A1R0GWL6_9FUNG|nr:hypothetical protein AYI68_g4660 [Smittium mucronatum]